jgi:branched-chain amino acid transport system ATP-binding protein
MLSVNDLSVRYGHVDAVNGVTLEVKPGEVVALLGPNAAGKTSTLRACSGTVRFGGSIQFDGVDVSKSSPYKLARAGLIHVPEGRRIFANLTVRENLQLGFGARCGRRGWSYDDIFDLFPQLVRLRDRMGWALSGGEQQMLAIGRALAACPRLLMLDEPALGLAPAVVGSVFERLSTVAHQVPLLLVEQNTTAALDVATRAYIMAQGVITISGDVEEIRARSDLVDSFLGHSFSAQ